MKITISKLPSPEHYGDWHDKPCRWIVSGPDKEIQKFALKADATKYATARRRATSQTNAITAFLT